MKANQNTDVQIRQLRSFVFAAFMTMNADTGQNDYQVSQSVLADLFFATGLLTTLCVQNTGFCQHVQKQSLSKSINAMFLYRGVRLFVVNRKAYGSENGSGTMLK
jgi:hypothetical protein